MRDDNFPRDNALSGLVSRCSMGEDRDWEKSQMEGQHELNLTCGTAQSVPVLMLREDALLPWLRRDRLQGA